MDSADDSLFALPGVTGPPIRSYWVERHVTPLARAHGAKDWMDRFASQVLAQRERARPVTIVGWGADGARVEVALARRLVAAGFTQFHVDCMERDLASVDRARGRIREAGVDGHVTPVLGPSGEGPRGPGEYDVHLLIRALGRGGRDPEPLHSVLRAMTERSVALVVECFAAAAGTPHPQAAGVLDALWPELLSKHRYDHVARAASTAARAARELAVRADDEDALAVLSSRLDFEDVIGVGGLVDPFVGAVHGPSLLPGSIADTRLIDAVAGLERDLLARGSLWPTWMIATLRPKGRVTTPLLAAATMRPPVPTEAARAPVRLALPREEPLMSHALGTLHDDRHLIIGFHPWEPESGVRWTALAFAVGFEAPPEPVPYECEVRAEFLAPAPDADGGMDVFANRTRIGRVEAVYRTLAEDPDHACVVRFATVGGPIRMDFVLERPQVRPDDRDHRELGLVLRKFSVAVRRR